MVVHRISSRKLTREVLRDGKLGSLVWSFLQFESASELNFIALPEKPRFSTTLPLTLLDIDERFSFGTSSFFVVADSSFCSLIGVHRISSRKLTREVLRDGKLGSLVWSFLPIESASELSFIALPEKPLLSTTLQLILLDIDERFSFGTSSFFVVAGSSFCSLIGVHRISSRKLTREVLRDGKLGSLVWSFLPIESASELSFIALPEKPLLSTTLQLILLDIDERFSFGTSSFFVVADSSFCSLIGVHRISSRKLTREVLRDGKLGSLVWSFLPIESASELSFIALPEKPLLSTTLLLTLLDIDERFSFRTSSFFVVADSSFWSLIGVHRIPSQKLTREVLRDGQFRSLVVSVFNSVMQQRRLVTKKFVSPHSQS